MLSEKYRLHIFIYLPHAELLLSCLALVTTGSSLSLPAAPLLLAINIG